MVADSRYWVQARTELDDNWNLVQAGHVDGPKDWVEWLTERARDVRVGIDSRMVSHHTATALNQALIGKNSKLVYPPQNLVDLIWDGKPSRSREPIFVQPHRFTGMEASAKLAELRAWISRQPPSVPTYSKSEPKPSQMQVATLISSLPNIGESPSSYCPRVPVTEGMTLFSLAPQLARRRYSIQSCVPLVSIRQSG